MSAGQTCKVRPAIAGSPQGLAASVRVGTSNAMTTTRIQTLLLSATALVASAAFVAPAQGAMRSDRISTNLCLTTGGGRFVPIPGFPGERIDQRLLTDIAYLQRKYKIFVTDGYSDDPVHASNGEHPIGLAADIVPYTAAGGTWQDINRLAKLAEPAQNEPIPPFRWVGYNGDAGHGRGDHLHLSWDHSMTTPGRAARSVYTLRCPGASIPPSGGDDGTGATTPPPVDPPSGSGDKGSGGKRDDDGPAGGTAPGRGSGSGSGGLGVGRAMAKLGFGGLTVVESGGVSLP